MERYENIWKGMEIYGKGVKVSKYMKKVEEYGNILKE